MRILPEDPRLIDFALGELDPEEYTLIAAALFEAQNRDARALVDEMRGLSAAAGRALDEPKTPCLTDAQRSSILEHAAESPRRRPERMPRRRVWLRPVFGLGTAMLLGAVLLIAGLGGLRGSRFGLETEATKTASSPGKTSEKSTIPPEELDRLRALGYLGGDDTLPAGQMSGTAETATDSVNPIAPINPITPIDPIPASSEPATPATVVLASDDALEPLNIELPEASFKGTPCPYWSPVLEPDDYKDRPAFMVPKGTTILSRGKPVTSSEAPMLGKLTQITDGDKDFEKKCVVELPAGLQWVQLDLEAEQTIYGLVAWHYHDEKWVFFDIIVQVSDSPDFSSGVTTLYNNDYDNSAGLGIGADKEYIESYKGRLIQIPNGVHARYVRLYSNGNTTNEMNDYIEVEVYGQPAAGSVEQVAKAVPPDPDKTDIHKVDMTDSNDSFASLADVINTPTLLTAVLKSGAKQPNLRLIEVNDSTVIFISEAGTKVPFLRKDVEELVVQRGRVEKPTFVASIGSTLTPENQAILDRVWVRVNDVFQSVNDSLELKMRAAAMLARNGDDTAKNYLIQLLDTKDMKTFLSAGLYCYLADMPLPEALLNEGLLSGDRSVRTMSSLLAGLSGYQEADSTLKVLLQNRDDMFAVMAFKALAYLGDRDISPTLYDFLASRNEKRGDAAIEAFSYLGGTQLIGELKSRMSSANSTEKYRILRILNNLGDPEAIAGLKTVFNETPALQPEVALILARQGDFQAQQFLRNRLAQKESPTAPNLIYRARAAAALYKGGYPQAQSALQDLLSENDIAVKNAVYNELIDLADQQLLKIIQANIEKSDADVCIGACSAALAIADPEYRNRLLKIRDFDSYMTETPSLVRNNKPELIAEKQSTPNADRTREGNTHRGNDIAAWMSSTSAEATSKEVVPASAPASTELSSDAIYQLLLPFLKPFNDQKNGIGVTDSVMAEVPSKLALAKAKYSNYTHGPEALDRVINDLKEFERFGKNEDRWRLVKCAIESLDVLEPGVKTTIYSKDFGLGQLMINKPKIKVIGFQESNGETLVSVKVNDPSSLTESTYLIREGEEFHTPRNEDGTVSGPLLKMLRIIGDKHSVEFLYIPANITWVVLGPASTTTPKPHATPEPSPPPAPVLLASANGMGPLKIDLPEPFFGGTPVDYWSSNLEPEDYKDRPDIMVPAGTVLLSRDKPVSASCEALLGELRQINDGDKNYAKSSRVELGAGVQWAQIDLERECTLYALMVWHFHEGKRVYFDIIAQVSDMPDFSSGVTTVYNNDYDNSAGLGAGKDMEYIENNKGRLIPIPNGVTARYVRFYSNGNTTDEKNHYVEIEVFGILVK